MPFINRIFVGPFLDKYIAKIQWHFHVVDAFPCYAHVCITHVTMSHKVNHKVLACIQESCNEKPVDQYLGITVPKIKGTGAVYIQQEEG